MPYNVICLEVDQAFTCFIEVIRSLYVHVTRSDLLQSTKSSRLYQNLVRNEMPQLKKRARRSVFSCCNYFSARCMLGTQGGRHLKRLPLAALSCPPHLKRRVLLASSTFFFFSFSFTASTSSCWLSLPDHHFFLEMLRCDD